MKSSKLSRPLLVLLLFVLVVSFLESLGSLVSLAILFLLLAVSFVYLPTFFGSSWLPVPRKTITDVIMAVKPKKGMKVYDLGSGDGRFVMEVSKTGAMATGIEIDPVKWLLSEIAIKITRAKNANVIRSNFFSYDFRDADIVFCYLPSHTLKKLESRLKKLRKGTLIITYRFACSGLKLRKELKQERLYIYKV